MKIKHPYIASIMTPKTVVAFDLYGTLLSTESVSSALEKHFGKEKAATVSALWRRYQLEYTWRLNSMEIYTSFSDITKASLKHALAESSCRLSDSEVANLLKAYDSLSTFPDVVPALKSLSSIPDLEAYIFSNGTQNMVSSSLKNSPDLSPHSDIFKSLVTIESAGAFKPSPKVYGYLAERIGMKGEEGNIWLVSGNPFDVVGAIKSGLKAAWVDRPCGHHNEGIWKDQLGLLCGIEGPTFIAKGVDEAVKKIGEYMDRNK